ncbi:MAG: DUF45 domain-containing protein [Sphingomonas sp.]|nr:DUF45 domain-containing protein [Sphingomonas sp.]RZV49732.1 MAG: DUF45 domain-containing protein [Sphingomonadaceae bacterium]
MKLRYDAIEDRLLLTLPPRASERKARAWVQTQTDWIEQQRGGRATAMPLTPGGKIPFRDGELVLRHAAELPRRIERVGDALQGGGPQESFSRRIETWLRDEARRLLSDDVAEFAQLAKVNVRAVSVGDARTRWGSCTHDGKLRFSWRLVCAPDAVRRYVAAHEVAHRVHMDHGRAFHRLEQELFGGPTAKARKLLRELGPRLQRIGR